MTETLHAADRGAALSKGGLLAVLLTPLCMYQADATIVNVASPAIHTDLGTSGAELELVVGGYLLASATLFITGARLGEMWGYRRIFLTGLATFTLASLSCGLAPGPVELIGARVVQGVGGALMIPQILTSVQLSFEEGPERRRALGLYPMALASGAVLGQVLGGVLVSANLAGAQWRPIFLVNVPIGLAVFAAARRFLPVDRQLDRSRRVDLPGVAILSGALLMIVLPLTLGRQEHWPLWTWLCLAASAPLLACFVALERRVSARGGSPLINTHVIARPAISWGLGPPALTISTYYALLFTLALFLQQGLGYSPLASGLTLLSFIVAFAVAGRVGARTPDRLRPLLPIAGCLLLAVAYLAIGAGMVAGRHPEGLLVVSLGVGGFGLGTAYNAMLERLTTAATPRYAPDISGVFTTTGQVAGVLGVATFGSAYLGLLSGPGQAAATHAFGLIALALALVAAAAAGIAYRATRVPAVR